MQADRHILRDMDTDHRLETFAILIGIVYCLAVIIYGIAHG